MLSFDTLFKKKKNITAALRYIYCAVKSPFTQKCVFLIVTSPGCLNFTVQNDVCVSLTLDGCFHIYLPNWQLFFCVHQSFNHGCISKICDTVSSLKAKYVPLCNLHKWNVET